MAHAHDLNYRCPYVTVVHRTGRAFQLNRKYELLTELAEHARAEPPAAPVQVLEGWVPTGRDQKPQWALALPETEFTAYWTRG